MSYGEGLRAQPGMKQPLRIPVSLGTILFLVLSACAETERQEVFEASRAEMAGALGAECGEVIPDLGTAVVVEDTGVPECNGGLCARRGPLEETSNHRGTCSCRCDGPEGTGPFCSCGEGFACEKLVEELAFGFSPLAGSYCMPVH